MNEELVRYELDELDEMSAVLDEVLTATGPMERNSQLRTGGYTVTYKFEIKQPSIEHAAQLEQITNPFLVEQLVNQLRELMRDESLNRQRS